MKTIPDIELMDDSIAVYHDDDQFHCVCKWDSHVVLEAFYSGHFYLVGGATAIQNFIDSLDGPCEFNVTIHGGLVRLD